MSDDHEDQELDPKRLKFGISPAERRELEREARRKKKKIPKNWKPQGH